MLSIGFAYDLAMTAAQPPPVQAYSALAPESFTTLAHLAISVAW